MRDVVKRFYNLGPLPNSNANPDVIGTYKDILQNINQPITDEEAIALVKLFGPDDCFGLAWTLLHLIETAPGWPIEEALIGDNEWIMTLKNRIENAKRLR